MIQIRALLLAAVTTLVLVRLFRSPWFPGLWDQVRHQPLLLPLLPILAITNAMYFELHALSRWIARPETKAGIAVRAALASTVLGSFLLALAPLRAEKVPDSLDEPSSEWVDFAPSKADVRKAMQRPTYEPREAIEELPWQ